jgi:hypothetical protein
VPRFVFILLMAACAAARAAERKPDWIDRESGRWPREMYVTGVGSADERAVAEDRARADLARVFTSHVSSALNATASEDDIRTDRGNAHSERITVVDETRSTTDKVLEGVEIAEVWLDTASRQTYALAVLDRQQAAARIEAKLDELAQTAKPLRARLAAADKVLALNAALRLLRLERDRRAVENELQIVLPSRERKPSTEDGARELLSRVSVRVTVAGDDQDVVRGGLAKALGMVGLSLAATAEPDLVGEASVVRESLGLRDGWYWSRASVAVVLKDAASSRTLLQLTETARDASRAEGESDRRVLGKVSERLRSAVAAALVASAGESVGSP